ncbi:MAG: hypothetical protein K0S12_983 [Bacteroidetes bacterium]|nr:hypothetical protein [Bacteroidota bacterium]
MFTTGRIIFVIFFLLVFIGGLIWSYRKDFNTTKIHFKRSYLILAGLIIFLTILFLIVKMRKFL